MSIRLSHGMNTELKFKTTIFPDKTSQVWQIEPFELALPKVFVIQWQFESEAELIHVLQLATLLKTEYPNHAISLSMDYLPYARQDKSIDNNATFALSVFNNVLKSSGLFAAIGATDIHNPKAVTNIFNNIGIVNEMIENISENEKVNFICFPDKGATSRGYYGVSDSHNNIILDKKRNQITGEIEGLKFDDSMPYPRLVFGRVLIVDDLCDGGRTFIEAAKLLKANGAEKVFLYTTHGIYSKGTQILFDNGLDKVFNLKQEIKGN